MSAEPWYCAKCIFRHTSLPAEGGKSIYEERIVLFRASSEDQAVDMAEREAKLYATDGIEYLGFVELHHLAADRIGDGTELYSLMRSSTLAPRDYLNLFYDTGTEHSRGKKRAN